MDSPLVLVDDKHVPLYRIMWIAATPHFCGEDDCVREGQYEIMLEMDEVIWASGNDRDRVLDALARWCGDGRGGGGAAGSDDETPGW